MQRKKFKALTPFLIMVSLFIAWLLFQKHGMLVLFIPLFALAIGVVFFKWINYVYECKAEVRRQARFARVRQVVEQNQRVLLRKQRQGTFYDEYDMKNDSKWQSDLQDFAKRVLPAKVDAEDLLDLEDISVRCLFVEDILDELAQQQEAVEESPPKPSRRPSTHSVGIAFEMQCADVLRQAGWHARITAASGDQGVDIEAQRNGLTIVVQCKHYSSPVGNGAVQEIAAGVLHYGADRGVVVSRSSYTAAARRLANTTGVLLVDFDDLKYIDILLDDGQPGPTGGAGEPESVAEVHPRTTRI